MKSLSLRDYLGGVIPVGVGPAQHEQVVGGEFHRIEAQRKPAATRLPAKVGAGPVHHRHEIVTDDLQPVRREVAHRLDPAVDMLCGPVIAKLDGGMHRNALHHRPCQPFSLDKTLAGRDVIGLPDLARGGRVKRGDNPVGAGLPNV